MPRILAIDFGRRRTGLAVTDTLQIAANPLTTIPTHTLEQFLLDYISREPVETIVIGEPRQNNGAPSESMRYLQPVLNRLRKILPHEIRIELYDERFTSVIAHQAMLDGGMKKSDRQDKARVDTIAATIILTDYLNSINHNQ